ncbi:MAG: hypothetical protein ONB23_00270 [candidate division KSB1 bacterium]|nr:hypothetical protein [candidate division KSB1 bacterium]
MKGTLAEVVKALEGKTEVLVLRTELGGTIVVTPSYGARVIGAGTAGLESTNWLWVNAQVLRPSFWQREPRDWNLGGARTWIAPEDRFYLDKENNWFVPPQMDPGSYQITSRDESSVTCVNEFEITTRDDQPYSLRLLRKVELLRSLPEEFGPLSSQVRWVSFRTTHELENLGSQVIGKDVDRVGLWSLDQVVPGGTMIIPIRRAEKPPYRDYFDPIPPDRISVTDDAITVKIDGRRRGKIGIAPWAARPILLLLERLEQGRAVLFVKQFPLDPEGVYLDHPWGKPSEFGDPVQIYNDSGQMGGFAEMECHGPAQVLAAGEKETLTTTLTILEGPESELVAVGERLTGLRFAALRLY